eukprot:1427812-Pyramimonas_sp.AAC.1
MPPREAGGLATLDVNSVADVVAVLVLLENHAMAALHKVEDRGQRPPDARDTGPDATQRTT